MGDLEHPWVIWNKRTKKILLIFLHELAGCFNSPMWRVFQVINLFHAYLFDGGKINLNIFHFWFAWNPYEFYMWEIQIFHKKSVSLRVDLYVPVLKYMLAFVKNCVVYLLVHPEFYNSQDERFETSLKKICHSYQNVLYS